MGRRFRVFAVSVLAWASVWRRARRSLPTATEAGSWLMLPQISAPDAVKRTADARTVREL